MLGILVSIGLAAALVLGSTSPAPAAESPLVLGSGKRTESVVVATGKSQNIRTEASFVDVVVGDPEIADVLPLTDHSLSILGKKIGTTRVSVYGDGKRLAGGSISKSPTTSPDSRLNSGSVFRRRIFGFRPSTAASCCP